MRRSLATAAALAVAAGLVGGCSSAGSSSGSSSTRSIVCKGIVGSITTTTTLTECTGGQTGGSSTPLGPALQQGGTITWTSGSTTTVGAPGLQLVHTPGCNGTENAITAQVTADSGNGIKVPGTFTGTACLNLDGTITVVKPFTIT